MIAKWMKWVMKMRWLLKLLMYCFMNEIKLLRMCKDSMKNELTQILNKFNNYMLTKIMGWIIYLWFPSNNTFNCDFI